MSFGLKNAGATYQRAATTFFYEMMHQDVEVYVDDMIVKSRDRSDHLVALERFFERIRQFRLRLNPKKCTFGVTSGKLLGYMVNERGIKVDPDNIRAILVMPTPRTEREVRGFLSRLQYISRFIVRLTDICEPIFRLLRKSQPTVLGRSMSACIWEDQRVLVVTSSLRASYTRPSFTPISVSFRRGIGMHIGSTRWFGQGLGHLLS